MARLERAGEFCSGAGVLGESPTSRAQGTERLPREENKTQRQRAWETGSSSLESCDFSRILETGTLLSLSPDLTCQISLDLRHRIASWQGQEACVFQATAPINHWGLWGQDVSQRATQTLPQQKRPIPAQCLGTSFYILTSWKCQSTVDLGEFWDRELTIATHIAPTPALSFGYQSILRSPPSGKSAGVKFASTEQWLQEGRTRLSPLLVW